LAPSTGAKTGTLWEGRASSDELRRTARAEMSDILLRVIAFFVLTTATTILMVLAYY
jgi:hypothetical protein